MLVAMLPCVQCKPAADNVTIRGGGVMTATSNFNRRRATRGKRAVHIDR